MVESEPSLQEMVADAKNHHHTHQHHSGASRLSLSGPGAAATLAAGPPLETLEEIYNETHWNPTWTSYIMLNILGYFLELPEVVQDIVMEEILLFIPATSFFVSKGIFSQQGRVRRGTYNNGGFLLMFALVFGNIGALAITRATRGCFNATSTRVFSDKLSQETHSPDKTLKRDDHPSQHMSSETEWKLTEIRSLQS